MEAAGAVAAARARPVAVGRRALDAVPLVAIVGIAAALRLWSFAGVNGNPFYDAAVRSMSRSWHNLFVGAFDPTASTAVDKAPLDLWLQVASVKLLGFSSTSLRLPELLAGIAAVLLVFDLGRRLFGRSAGLAAAAALAVLPASVLTARSDTMDAVMMALVVLAAWCVVRAAQAPARQLRWMLAAGAALGLAFNVKLAEALLPLPALVLLAWLALGGGAWARVRAVLAGGAAFVAVALAWLVALSLAPGHKPFPIGSTDGSAWNVVFVFDGIGRLGFSRTTTHRPVAGPLALLQTSTGALGTLVGTVLIAALLVGGLALVLALVERRAAWPRAHDALVARLRRAGVACVATWLLVGLVVYSRMVVVYARYIEAIAPAIALALGAGAAALAARAPARRPAALALALGAGGAAALAVPVAHPRTGDLVVAGAGVALIVVLAAIGRVRRRVPAGAFLALGVAGLLAVPTFAAVDLAQVRSSDGGEPGAMPTTQLTRLSNYLRAHRHGARYEVATMAAASAGALIAHDGQPVLVLTTAYGRPLTTAHQLAADVRSGQVRYVLAGGATCVRGRPRDRTGCAPAVEWARAHGHDVGRAAGIRRGLLLRLRP